MLRIGTLGSSRISEPALIEPSASVAEATVAAVAARDLARAEAFALRYGIEKAYGSYQEMLDDPDVDAIYNPLPNSLHGPWALRAIAAGKHVLCEKPFASNANEAAQVAQAAAGSGLVVMEAMHYRYHPLARRMAELLRDGAQKFIAHSHIHLQVSANGDLILEIRAYVGVAQATDIICSGQIKRE